MKVPAEEPTSIMITSSPCRSKTQCLRLTPGVFGGKTTLHKAGSRPIINLCESENFAPCTGPDKQTTEIFALAGCCCLTAAVDDLGAGD